MVTKVDQQMIDAIAATGASTPRPIGDHLRREINVLNYGADPTGTTDSLAAFNLAMTAMGENDLFLVPQGIYRLSGKFVFTEDFGLFRSEGTISPFGSYSDFLIEFRKEAGAGELLNIAQHVGVERLYLDCEWQCRGVKFVQPYNTSMSNVVVMRPYGTGIAMDGGYECDWNHPIISLGHRRNATWTFADWNNGATYVNGDYVRRTYPDYNAGTAYVAADIATYDGRLWRCIVAGIGQQPDISPATWRPIPHEYFLCKISHTNMDPHSLTGYTTNSSTAGNRYWQMVYYDEAGVAIDCTEFGAIDLQRFWMLNIRDSDYQTKIRIDHNLDDRFALGIEFYGLDCENIAANLVAASSGELVQDNFAYHIQLGRTYRTVFVGGNFRMSSGTDSTMLQAGWTAPLKACLALKVSFASFNGEGARPVGLHWLAGSIGNAANYMADVEFGYSAADDLGFVDLLGQAYYTTPFKQIDGNGRTTIGDLTVSNGNLQVAHQTAAGFVKVQGALTGILRLRDEAAAAGGKVADLVKFGAQTKIRTVNDAETALADAFVITQDSGSLPARQAWNIGAAEKAYLDASNGLTVQTDTNFTPCLRILSTDATEPGAGPVLLIDRLPAANPTGPFEGGYQYFRAKDDTGATQVLVELTSFCDDATVANYTSRLVVAANYQGNIYKKLWSIGGGIYARRLAGTDLPDPGAGKINALGYLLDDYEAATTGTLRSQISDDTGAAGPFLELYRISTTPAVNDLLGLMQFYGRDSANNKQAYAAIQAVSTGVTSGAEVGLLQIHTTVAGTLASRWNIQQGFYAQGLTDPGLSKVNATGYNVSNTAVVGARDTGWTAPTGTATKTTFDTATVTLPQLAEHVKALLDALTTHGLIGA